MKFVHSQPIATMNSTNSNGAIKLHLGCGTNVWATPFNTRGNYLCVRILMGLLNINLSNQ